MDGCYGYCRIFVCSKGIQTELKSQQGYDDFIACADCYSCDKQSYFIGCCRGHKVLPCSWFRKVQSIGIGHIITSAMSQAFFTLSLGIASMEILGSYMTREKLCRANQLKFAYLILLSLSPQDLSSSLPVFIRSWAESRSCSYICYTAECICKYGGRQNLGHAVLYVYDLCVFLNRNCGVWNLISFCIDMFNMSRTKSVIINAIIMLIGCLPCILDLIF